jgi:hypothetical protein
MLIPRLPPSFDLAARRVDHTASAEAKPTLRDGAPSGGKSQGKDPHPRAFENSGETASAPYGLDARCEPWGPDVRADRQGLGPLPANKISGEDPTTRKNR